MERECPVLENVDDDSHLDDSKTISPSRLLLDKITKPPRTSYKTSTLEKNPPMNLLDIHEILEHPKELTEKFDKDPHISTTKLSLGESAQITIEQLRSESAKTSRESSPDNRKSRKSAVNDPQFDYTKPIYLCKVCSILLVYEEYIMEKREHFYVIKAAFNYKVNELSENDKFTSLYCIKCENDIGVKIKNEFYLYASILEPRKCHVNIGLYSLKEEEMIMFGALVEQISDNLKLSVHYTKTLLKKATLRTTKIKENVDACILLHKNEGRLLLTDKNGLYSEFLIEAHNKSQGNELVIITNFDEQNNPQETDAYPLYDAKKLDILADEGAQPFMKIMYRNFKVLTVNSEYNMYQLEYLSNFLHRALYKSIVPEEYMGYSNKYKNSARKKVDTSKDSRALGNFLKEYFNEDKKLVEMLLDEIKNINETRARLRKSDDNCTLL